MNNKKYHFVKVGLVNDPTYHGTLYFKPESKEDVDEHWNKYNETCRDCIENVEQILND